MAKKKTTSTRKRSSGNSSSSSTGSLESIIKSEVGRVFTQKTGIPTTKRGALRKVVRLAITWIMGLFITNKVSKSSKRKSKTAEKIDADDVQKKINKQETEGEAFEKTDDEELSLDDLMAQEQE